jgi:hypothetical protein
MRSFADLFQYFAAKGVVRPSTPSAKSSREKRGGGKKKPSMRNGESSFAAPGPALPVAGDDQQKSNALPENASPSPAMESAAPSVADNTGTGQSGNAISNGDRPAAKELEQAKINTSPAPTGDDPAQTDSSAESP